MDRNEIRCWTWIDLKRKERAYLIDSGSKTIQLYIIYHPTVFVCIYIVACKSESEFDKVQGIALYV
jgi:hypothetical protein